MAKIGEVSFNQVITNYSNEVKNRHVQFGDPTSLSGRNSKCTFMASLYEMYGKNFQR